MDLAVKVATEPPLQLTAACPGVPAGFARVVMRCLEKNREQRFRDVGELAVALREFGPPRASGSVDRILRTVAARTSLHDESLPAAAPSSRNLPEAHADTVHAATPLKTQSSWGAPSRDRGPERRWLLWGAGGAALAALLGAGVLVLRHPAEPSTAVSSALIAPSAPAPTVSPPPSPSVSEAVAAPSVAPPTASQASSAPAKPATPRPGGPAIVPPPPPAVPAPPPAAPAASRANCSPPYVIDALGHRQFKPECL